MRIPINYVGTVRCPKCKFQFDKISKLDSETIDEEKPEKTNTCTNCGGINGVESGLNGYYRCKHCGYDVLTLEQSENFEGLIKFRRKDETAELKLPLDHSK